MIGRPILSRSCWADVLAVVVIFILEGAAIAGCASIALRMPVHL